MGTEGYRLESSPHQPEPPFPLKPALQPTPTSYPPAGCGSPVTAPTVPTETSSSPEKGTGKVPALREEKGPRPKGVIGGRSCPECRSPQTPKGAAELEKVLQSCGPGWGWVGFRVLGRDLRPAANMASLRRGYQEQSGGLRCPRSRTYLPGCPRGTNPGSP